MKYNNYDLIHDMFYAAPEFWIVLLIVIIVMFSYLYTKILKLKRKNYFLNRDRERFSEMLYALKDGYFAFIYPDIRINDYCKNIMEKCSRRLAVMLNLKNGINSKFTEVLEQFYKDDAKKIQKYLALLREEGVAFEDAFMLKNNNSYITLAGCRINGYDGNVYCDVLWFRDVSTETQKILSLEKEKIQNNDKMQQFETLLNGLPYPAFLRNENLNISIYNKKYKELAEIVGKKNKDSMETEFSCRNLALLAQNTNKIQEQIINVIVNGESKYYSVIVTPIYEDGSLEKICTICALIDVSELDELKRNLKLHQNVHLQVLSMLGTAFAVFDKNYNLSFYNEAFLQSFKLDKVYLDVNPTYSNLLDVLREKGMLPEVPDFKMYKKEEQNEFDNLIENKEDLLHLPDGRTLRRVRAPQPSGGMVFAFEDVSDKLATRRAYNLQQEIQEQILNNSSDAILIFGPDGYLKSCNKSYMNMWHISEENLLEKLSLTNIIDMQKNFFDNTEDWNNLRRCILEKIVAGTYQTVRNDKIEILAHSVNLPDGSVMIIYKKK